MDPEPSGGYQPKGTPGRKKRILRIDGCGVRGLISAVILERLESHLQKFEGKDARIPDYFDVIAGTSTGALIACLLVVPGGSVPDGSKPKQPKYSAKDAIDFYIEHSSTVFPQKSSCCCGCCCGCFCGCLRYLLSWFTRLKGPLYSPDPLEEQLKKKFGDLKLSETVKPVIVPSYDIKDEMSVHFSTAKVKSKVIPDCFFRDVCRATSAAPTYFASYQFSAKYDNGEEREFNMVDGGISANNPSFIAVSELRRDDSNRPKNETPDDSHKPEPLKYEDLLVLSLGTGKTTVGYDVKTTAKWGTLCWTYNKGNVPIIDMLMMASEDIVDYNLSNTFYQQESHRNYIRVQERELPEDQKELDNSSTSNLKALQETARKLLEKRPKERNKFGELVPHPRWTTYDAALKEFAAWLVDEKEAQRRLGQPSFTP